jgi:hypothetical protein
VNLPSEIMPHGKIGGDKPNEKAPEQPADKTPDKPPTN